MRSDNSGRRERTRPGFLVCVLCVAVVREGTQYPPQQRGLSDSVSLLHPGFRHQCNAVDMYGKKEAGTGEHLNTFNQINKYKWKAAAPHGRLPQTKHKLKFQAWSSLVFHCCHSSFNPSEAPPWDSRPVSGAGVVHYQLLHMMYWWIDI